MKTFSMTDIGRKREINQDYVFATDETIGNLPNLLVVADGMGGHRAGDFASRFTVEVLAEEATYLPYDDKMYENMPSWSKGFIGFMGNLNKTVIKICPLYYMDGNNEGAYIMSMWPYGISSTGDVEQDKLLNNKYEDPVGPYYLIRKDVADGLVLQLPDTEEPDADVAGLLNALQSVRQANTPREVFSVKR